MSHIKAEFDSSDLDEWLAECEEHLASARQLLLRCEAAGDLTMVGQEDLDTLFRAFHTIKGLAGMVGARAVERAANLLEGYLAAARKGEARLNWPAVLFLIDGADVIEQAAVAFRAGEPESAALDLDARAATLLQPDSLAQHSESTVLPPATNEQIRLAAALGRGARVWHVSFVPTPELSARGVNVNAVRSRLAGVGDIVRTEPMPTGGGRVRFSFLVASAGEPDFADWAVDGITVEPYIVPAHALDPSSGGAAPARSTAARPATINLVRVDLKRLDDVMQLVGDLVVSRARLQGSVARASARFAPADRRELDESVHALDRDLKHLRKAVMRVRMVPIRELFGRMQLVVRDLTRETGGEVDLVVAGEDTEIDKYLVERIADPLLHLVRNAVSHGLEPAPERLAAAKPVRGRVNLRAMPAGGSIVLEVEDDGRGIDTRSVVRRAREAGLMSNGSEPDAAGLLALICTPGFSTRDVADRASGRGVGMDVVRRAVEELGGQLELRTRPGAGTCFTTRLPLTLVVADVLIVQVGDRTFAVPQSTVREVALVEPGSTTRFETNELIRFHDRAIPLLRLNDAFGIASSATSIVALVADDGLSVVALGADRAVGLREVVVRPVGDPLVKVPGVSGATDLGDGRPTLILDPSGLLRHVGRGRRAASSRGESS